MPTPSPIDLTTVSAVKTWLSANGQQPANTLDDQSIQDLVTAFSSTFLWKTGYGTLDGTEQVESPFVEPVNYNEWYDGNGSFRMFLRNKPIVTIITLNIGNWAVPQSTGWGVQGWVIDGTFSSISLRGGGGGSSFASSGYSGYNYRSGFFTDDVQNVNVQYTAGYQATPPDIEMAARKSVALYYVRKGYIGLKSRALAQGGGTTAYQDWEFDPDVEKLICNYSRFAVV